MARPRHKAAPRPLAAKVLLHPPRSRDVMRNGLELKGLAAGHRTAAVPPRHTCGDRPSLFAPPKIR
jgi:hypothetical protein